MGAGPTTQSEIVRAVVVGKRALPVAVALAVVMIWSRHVGTGRVSALGAPRTAWCSILRRTRARLGNTATATNEGHADVQGRGRPKTVGCAGEAEMGITGTGRVGIVTVTVTITVTGWTEIDGAKSQCCTYPVQTIYRHLRMPDRLQSFFASFYSCAPKP